MGAAQKQPWGSVVTDYVQRFAVHYECTFGVYSGVPGRSGHHGQCGGSAVEPQGADLHAGSAGDVANDWLAGRPNPHNSDRRGMCNLLADAHRPDGGSGNTARPAGGGDWYRWWDFPAVVDGNHFRDCLPGAASAQSGDAPDGQPPCSVFGPAGGRVSGRALWLSCSLCPVLHAVAGTFLFLGLAYRLRWAVPGRTPG